MNLSATIRSERGKTILKTGNDFIQILLQDEDRKNIAQLNVFYDLDGRQILTTFVPLNCQEYTKEGNGKALAIKNNTRRYCTAI